MMDLTKARAVVSFELDSTKFKEGAKAMQAENAKLSGSLDAVGDNAERMQTTLSKMANVASGGFDKVTLAMRAMMTGANSGVASLNNFAGKLGPWNQALELGGKAARLLGDAMEGAAKRHPEYADAYKNLTTEVNGYKNAVMDAMGIATIEALKPIPSLQLLQKELRGVTGAFEDAFNAKIKGSASGGLSYLLGGGILRDVTANTSDSWGTQPPKSLEELAKRLGIAMPAQGRAAASVATAGRRRDVSEYASITGTDTAGGMLGFAAPSLGGAAMYDNSSGIAAAMAQLEQSRQTQLTAQWQDEIAKTDGRRAGYLERAFGPIEQYDAYGQAFTALGGVFGAFTDAVGSGYEAIVGGQGSVIGAMKAAASAGIMATGKQSMVDGLRETALGFASLAKGPIGGVSAAAHFKSAAIHGAVALAAGVAANALGAGGGGASPVPSVGASSGASSGARSSGSGTSAGETTTTINYIILGDSQADDSPRMRQRNAERTVALAEQRTSAGRAE